MVALVVVGMLLCIAGWCVANGQEEFQRLDEAGRELGREVVKALKLDKLADWLERRL